MPSWNTNTTPTLETSLSYQVSNQADVSMWYSIMENVETAGNDTEDNLEDNDEDFSPLLPDKKSKYCEKNEKQDVDTPKRDLWINGHDSTQSVDKKNKPPITCLEELESWDE